MPRGSCSVAPAWYSAEHPCKQPASPLTDSSLQGEAMNLDSSKDPKIFPYIYIYIFVLYDPKAVVPEQDTLQQGLQQLDLQRSGFRLQLDQSPVLMAALTRAHRRVVSLVWAVSLESLRKSGKPENAQVLNKPEMLGQKTVFFFLPELRSRKKTALLRKQQQHSQPPVSSLLERAIICLAGSLH